MMDTKKAYWLFLIILFTAYNGNTQSHFAKKSIFGTSIAPFLDFQNTGFEDELFYVEYSWNKHAAISLTKNFYFGINYINVFAKYISPPAIQSGKLNNFLVGGFVLFRPKITERIAVKILSGVNYGNHCTCTLEYPVKLDGLTYLSIGGGIDLPIAKGLYLDLNLQGNAILNKIPRRYAYNILQIGLVYEVGQQTN